MGGMYGGGAIDETVFGVVLAVSIAISMVVSWFAVKWLEPRRKALAILFTIIMASFFPFVILLAMPTPEARMVVQNLLFAPHPYFLAGTRIAIALVFVLAWCGIEAMTVGGFSLSGFFGGEDLPENQPKKLGQHGQSVATAPSNRGPKARAATTPSNPTPTSRPARTGFGHRGAAR
jgi:hypothetical protein